MAQRKKETVDSLGRGEAVSNDQADGESRALRAPGRARAGDGRAPRQAAPGRDGASGRGTQGSTTSRGRSGKLNLQKELRDFASARPQGWGHDDWLNFLSGLEEKGHNIADREAIGRALEKERMDLALSDVKGVGPQRRQALIERFGNLWSLRRADASEIASAAGMPRNLADQVKSRVSGH
jgi:hypothetical protein